VLSSLGILGGCFVLAGLGGLAYLTWSVADKAKQPRYHVAVDGVAGLDPLAVLMSQRRPTLDPEFNLTVGLASRSFTRGRLLLRRRVGGAGVLRRRPARRRGVAQPLRGPAAVRGARASVVAWGSGVRVPRLVRAALSRDLMRRGAAEFDVALTVMKQPVRSGGKW
jgi:hypothetical protein